MFEGNLCGSNFLTLFYICKINIEMDSTQDWKKMLMLT